MKSSLSFDLLNSEGPIVKIEKIGPYWNWKFHNASYHIITTPREILNFIADEYVLLNQSISERIMFKWSEFSEDMKPDREKLNKIIEILLKEEIELCKTDSAYFYKTYCKTKLWI